MGRITPKYKSKAVYWDSLSECVIGSENIEQYRRDGRLRLPNYIWRFDSQHEFKVYLELKRMYGADKIDRQHRLLIIPPGACYPKGKYWKVDFRVKRFNSSDLPNIFVEAKGVLLPEFICVLTHLERNAPDIFYRTKIVFRDNKFKQNTVAKALMKSNFANNLLVLKDLEHLLELP